MKIWILPAGVDTIFDMEDGLGPHYTVKRLIKIGEEWEVIESTVYLSEDNNG